MEKIFIQIAAYRDPELVPTINDCLKNADKPENLVFSIAWQHSEQDEWDNLDEFRNDLRFRILDIDYKDSKGCCWARNALQQQYDGEEYTLQLDSHHRFIKHWDTELIKMYKDLQKKGFKKPLITTYLPAYNPMDEPNGRVMTPCQMDFDKFIPEGAIFFKNAYVPNWEQLTEPVRARFYSAHFAFTCGEFVKEVPHDPNYFFHGEEISIGVRAFTHGYDLFHPHKLIAWHEYTRNYRVKYWDESDDNSRDKKWYIKNEECHLRNRKLFEMDGNKKDIDFGIYDFGTERTLKDYEEYAGVSFKKRSVQKYTLDNKYPPNPKEVYLSRLSHTIEIEPNTLTEKDYDFIVVAYENNGKQLFRKDITIEEIKRMNLSEKVSIKREFDVSDFDYPIEWVVWPHSKSKGWLNRLTGKV